MSVADLLNTTITVRRQTITKSPSGGARDSFGTIVVRDEPAMIQTSGGSIRNQFLQRAEVTTAQIYTARDIGARAKDRVEETDARGNVRHYLVMSPTYEATVGYEEAWITVAEMQPR